MNRRAFLKRGAAGVAAAAAALAADAWVEPFSPLGRAQASLDGGKVRWYEAQPEPTLDRFGGDDLVIDMAAPTLQLVDNHGRCYPVV